MSDPCPASEAELEDRLSQPSKEVIEVLRRLPGDLLVLGAGGKMGPSLARMARRAGQALGEKRQVIAVSRFRDSGIRAGLEADGVRTIAADLLESAALAALPDAPNVIFMAGQKFGSREWPATTWALNAELPVLAARRFPDARTVVFSTGNVYPFYPADSRGPTEADPVGPVGEYAMSCLARERIFEHASHARGLPVAILRLNYAVDLRYGVLVDIACRVRMGSPIPLAMGSANVIWQGDANACALRALALTSSPATVLNLTGPERLSVREAAMWFGRYFGQTPIFEGSEAPDALLSDASRARALFGPPRIGLETLMEWVATWLEREGRLLERPTKFEVRDGGF
jgi:nucleoside-diphosphate-sugar epimerase